MAEFWHTVFFGGSGEGVEQALVASYENCIVVNSTSYEEGSHISIQSDRGWGNRQNEVMGKAYTEGRVSSWNRITITY